MKIGILSDCRVPTQGVGGHGLGRVAWEVTGELAKRGHEITLHAGYGSTAPRLVTVMIMDGSEAVRAEKMQTPQQDVYLDFSHNHDLSWLRPDWAVVNYISDNETGYQPPNAVVCTEADLCDYPNARRVPLGIDVKSIPFYENGRQSYLAYLAKIITHKGVDKALDLAARGLDVHFAGENLERRELPHYRGELCGYDVYEYLGRAAALLQLATIGAGGGRISLEAAATGTPTLVFDSNGAQEHVIHCLTGFVVRDLDEMADAVSDLAYLNPLKIREWVNDSHSLTQMVDELEKHLRAVREGERW